MDQNQSQNQSQEPKMIDFKRYRKTATQLLRPYIPGEDLTGISVSPQDTPELGGMIAINEDNLEDRWYVAKAFFEGKYELVNPTVKADNLIDISYTQKPRPGFVYMRNRLTGECVWVEKSQTVEESTVPDDPELPAVIPQTPKHTPLKPRSRKK